MKLVLEHLLSKFAANLFRRIGAVRIDHDQFIRPRDGFQTRPHVGLIVIGDHIDRELGTTLHVNGSPEPPGIRSHTPQVQYDDLQFSRHTPSSRSHSRDGLLTNPKYSRSHVSQYSRALSANARRVCRQHLHSLEKKSFPPRT